MGRPVLRKRSLASVNYIPADKPQELPQDGIALCLSGGGYRAMLFHLGALWRLNEAGCLPKLARVSNVSGGSIVRRISLARVPAAGKARASHTKGSVDHER